MDMKKKQVDRKTGQRETGEINNCTVERKEEERTIQNDGWREDNPKMSLNQREIRTITDTTCTV